MPDHEATPAFREAYKAARREKTRQWRQGQRSGKPRRSVKDLVDLYCLRGEYARLMPDTRRVYGRVLQRLLQDEDFVSCSVAGLHRRHVQRLVDRHSHTPAGAADLLKKLRAIMRCAIAHGWRADDPTYGVKLSSANSLRNCADRLVPACGANDVRHALPSHEPMLP